MSVSPDVVILTVRELDDMKRAEFQRGVERGRFEEGAKHNAKKYGRVAAACANSNHGKGWASLSVLREVEAERHRQVTKEGYTAQHDDEHTDGAIAIGAAAYCLSAASCGLAPDIWPFERDAFKPRGGRDDLIRAAAMIVAEIERLDRRAEA